MTITTFILRLAVAFLLGFLVGFERQYRQKSAGLKTNTLVSVGAAAFILLSASLTGDVGDPSRVAGQIVTGIGFLGAGVIMRVGASVQGLNTAATLWCSAAIGALAGAGLLVQSALVSAAVLLAHILLRPIGRLLNRRNFKQEEDEGGLYLYTIQLHCKESVESHLRVLLINALKTDEHLQLRSLKSTDNGQPAHAWITAEVMANGPHHTEIEKITATLLIEYGVSEVSWTVHDHKND